ncbi:hypothetical protein C9374_001759 [Naegleria lovaniensis]|uniref:Tandem-95 repeat protein n=1 Tax=Naegleria lovaniensis TaxID=51637 RepID=A0AA88GRA1_NAELO|nr:uncharacterized protein C9374_001759 [Naegleria lovaniensis]KAG2387427.1 hypothetical protein C9374_001759 [Naegleria lovaniensis]
MPEQITFSSTTVGRSMFGVNLSLLKGGTITQTIVGGVISAMVVTSVVVTIIMVTVSAGVSGPTAKDDYAQVYKRRPFTIYPLLNDVDPKSLNLTLVNVTQPLHGSAVMTGGGKVVYTSSGSFAGNDSFTYYVTNGYVIASAQVNIEILNRPPELINLQYTVSKNSIKNAFDVFRYVSDSGAIISDPDSDDLVVSAVGAPRVNESSVSFDSLYVYYTPPKGFNSEDTFTYSVFDGNATATANIHVTVANDAPVCVPDYYIVTKNDMAVLNILANDYDINNDDVTIYSAGAGSIGTVILSDDKKNITYIPPPQIEPKTDSWEYQNFDGSLTGNSFVFIKIVNTPPQGGDRVFNVAKNSTNNMLDLTYLDSDMLDTVYVSLLTKPTRGTFQLVEYSVMSQVNYVTKDFYPVKVNTYKLVYTPESGNVYSESFQIKITDTIDLVTAKITINVTPVPPVANNDTALCAKNSNVTVNVVANDYSAAGDILKLTFTSLATLHGGEIRKLDDNNVMYIPAHDFTGTDVAPYYVSNTNRDGSTEGIFQTTGYLMVSVSNSPPIAKDDVVTVSKGWLGSFNLIANDADPNNDVIKYNDATTSSQGVTIGISSSSSLVNYQALNQTYIDYFTYSISDVEGAVSNYAKVTINVINDAPVAVADEATVSWNRSIAIEVLNNDQDINPGDKSNLVIKTLSTPSQGTVSSFQGGKKVLYTPPNGFTGEATFTYTVSDGIDNSNTANVKVIVVNNAPKATADVASVHWFDNVVVIPVLANDADDDGDALHIESFTQPSKGVVTRVQLADGSDALSYTSISFNNFTGNDTFTYVVSDYGKTSVGVVTVQVTDKAPIAANDVFTMHWRSSNVELDVLQNDSDENNDPLTISTVSTPSNFKGTVTKNAQSNKLIFSPTFESLGTQTISYTCTDRTLSSQSAQVSLITTNNDAPKNRVITKSVHWSTQSSGTQINIYDVPQPIDTDGDSLQLLTTASVSPQHGTVTISNGNSTTVPNVNYKQSNGYLGTDSFNLTLTDGAQTAQIQVVMTVYDNAPTASNYYEQKHFDVVASGYTRDVVVLCNAVDSDKEDTVSISQVTIASGGSISQSGNSITFTPTSGFTGNATITIVFTDGLRTTTRYWIIHVQNAEPVASPFTTSIHWTTTSTTINVLANITDTDNDVIDFRIVSSANSYGTPSVSTLAGVKQVTWTLPSPAILGTSSFTIEYTDGWASKNQSFGIYIQNAAPVATAKSISTPWSSYSTGVTIDVLSGCTDSDADSLSLASSPFTTPSLGTVSVSSGKALYRPIQGRVGLDSFQYTITDGISTSSQTVTVNVTNNRPIAVADSVSVHWSTSSIDIAVLNNDVDSDGDALSVSSITQPSQGSCSIVSNQVRYTLASTPTKETKTFTYKVNDGAQDSFNSATVSVTITNLNVPSIANQNKTVHWRAASAGVSYTVYNTPTDSDGDTLIPTVQSGPCSLVTSGSIKLVQYQHTSFEGTEDCYVKLSDGLDSDTKKLTTTSYDNAPVASPLTVQYYGANIQSGILIDVLSLATDSDVEDLPYLAITQTSASTLYGSGVATIQSGKIKYFPTPSSVTSVGTDTFTYTISDGLKTSTATVTVQIKSTVPRDTEQFYDVHWRACFSGIVLDPLSRINSTDTLTLDSTLISAPDMQGSVVVSSNGKNITYTPAYKFTGVETFTLRYTSSSGSSSINVTCTVYDTTPTASAVTATTHWRTNLVTSLVSSIGDADSADSANLQTYTGVQPSQGTYSISNNVVTYVPSSTIGSISMTYVCSDGLKNTSALLTVTTTNTPPTAAVKSYNVLWRSFRDGFDLDVLNLTPADSDANGDTIRVKSISSQPSVGTVTVRSGSSTNVTIQAPGIVFTGSLSFSYVVTDDASNGDVPNTVNLQVYNNAPTATDDSYSVHWNTASLVLDVLANDNDPNGDSLTIISVYGSLASTAPIIANNKITYYPSSAPLGQDVFYYVISDGVTTTSAKITVTVTNARPTTQNLSFNGLWSAAVNGIVFAVVGNSSDTNSDSLTLSSYSSISSSQGTLTTVDGGRSILYTPKTGFVGSVSTITFVISDSRETVTGTISITINNNAPTANTAAFSYHWRTVMSPTSISLGSRLSDADSDTVTITAITKVNQGSVTLGSNNAVTYKLSSAWKGTDTFTVSFTDGWTSSSATFTVTVTNVAPVSYNIDISSHFSNAYTLSIPVVGRSDALKPTDADSADGNYLVISSYTLPSLGTLTLSSDKKTFTFNNPSGNLVQQTFTYVISDGFENSATSTITISLQNVAPTSRDLSYTYLWSAVQNGFLINLLYGASDADGDSLSVSSFSQPSMGSVTSFNATTVKYTPTANTAGATSFQFKITDTAQTITQTVSITLTNNAPVAVADSYTNNWRSKTLTLSVLQNDNDPDNNNIYIASVDSVSASRSASLSISSDKRSIIYVDSTSTGAGSDSFKYTITDGVATSSAVTVSLTFTNTAPSATSSSTTMKWNEVKTFSNMLTQCSDPDSDPLSFAGVVQGSLGTTTVTDSAAGSFTYKPSTSITYTVKPTDGSAYRATDSIKYGCTDNSLTTYGTISIEIRNTPPQGSSKTNNVTRNYSNPTVTLTDLLSGVTDADGDTVTVSSVALLPNQDSGTSVVLMSGTDGSVKFTYSNSFIGAQQFYVYVTDGQLTSSYIYTVNITGSALSCVEYYITASKNDVSIQFEDNLRLSLVKLSGSEPATITVASTSTLNSVGSISKDSSTNKLTYYPTATRSCLNNNCYATYSYSNTAGQTVACRIYVNQANQAPNAPSYNYVYSVRRDSNSVETMDYLSLSNADDPDTADTLALTSVLSTGSCTSGLVQSISVVSNKINFQRQLSFVGSSCWFTVGVVDSDPVNPITVTANVTITPTALPPMSVNDFLSTKYNTYIDIPVSTIMSNDYDSLGGTFSFNGIDSCPSGKCSILNPSDSANARIIRVSPVTGSCDAQTFVYSIKSDQDQTTSSATVTVQYTSCQCYLNMDIIFLLDGSGSISDANWLSMKQFMSNITIGFGSNISPTGTNIGIVQFASSVTTHLQLTSGTSKDIVLNAISACSQLKSGTASNLGINEAVKMLYNQGRQDITNKIIIHVTDGESNEPCSCSACDSRYSSDKLLYGNVTTTYCKSPRFPGMSCSQCSWSSSTSRCNPCAEATVRSSDINSWAPGNSFGNPEIARFGSALWKWRQLAIGIGSGLSSGFGQLQIQRMNYDYYNQITVNWNSLGTVYQTVVDNACNTVELSQTKTLVPLSTSGYTVTYVGKSTSVYKNILNTNWIRSNFTYNVAVSSSAASGVEKFTLQLASGYNQDAFYTYSPYFPVYLGQDPISGYTGFTWESLPKSYTVAKGKSGIYSLILEGEVTEGTIPFAVSGGSQYAVGTIKGPSSVISTYNPQPPTYVEQWWYRNQTCSATLGRCYVYTRFSSAYSSSVLNTLCKYWDSSASLAMIQSAAEKTIIMNLLPKNESLSFFLGTTYSSSSKTYSWADGSSMSSYTDWQTNYPNNSPQVVASYVYTSPSNKWWINAANSQTYKDVVCYAPFV